MPSQKARSIGGPPSAQKALTSTAEFDGLHRRVANTGAREHKGLFPWVMSVAPDVGLWGKNPARKVRVGEGFRMLAIHVVPGAGAGVRKPQERIRGWRVRFGAMGI
jgi:hypothetical protein